MSTVITHKQFPNHKTYKMDLCGRPLTIDVGKVAELATASPGRATPLKEISERHRHRYEFNNDFRETLTAAGLRLAGLSPDGRLVEIVEIGDHPWFVGVQFHPELKSRPNRAHPLFREFIAAAKKLNNQQ